MSTDTEMDSDTEPKRPLVLPHGGKEKAFAKFGELLLGLIEAVTKRQEIISSETFFPTNDNRWHFMQAHVGIYKAERAVLEVYTKLNPYGIWPPGLGTALMQGGSLSNRIDCGCLGVKETEDVLDALRNALTISRGLERL